MSFDNQLYDPTIHIDSNQSRVDKTSSIPDVVKSINQPIRSINLNQLTEPIVYVDLRQKETYNMPTLQNVRAIHQSIMNILLTDPGERLFLPDFGVGLKRYLFSYPGDDTENELFGRIQNQIFQWEKRASLVAGQSYVTFNSNEKAYYIYLVINVPTLNISGYSMTVYAPLEL